MSKVNNLILAKLSWSANDVSQGLLFLDKSLPVSRTKAEMREYVESAKDALTSGRKRIDGPRNNLIPFDINDENNTIYDDIQALINKLGDVQYDLMQNDTKSAAEHLHEAMFKIRGY